MSIVTSKPNTIKRRGWDSLEHLKNDHNHNEMPLNKNVNLSTSTRRGVKSICGNSLVSSFSKSEHGIVIDVDHSTRSNDTLIANTDKHSNNANEFKVLKTMCTNYIIDCGKGSGCSSEYCFNPNNSTTTMATRNYSCCNKKKKKDLLQSTGSNHQLVSHVYCNGRGRNRNDSIGTTLFCITTTALVMTFLSLSLSSVHGHPQPPPPQQAGFLDFDNLPVTRFSCEGKVIGGYYADVETGCQMFHVCTLGQKDEVQDIKFLCLNGTVFDQETRVCERVDEVDCSQAEKFYDLNLDLYVPHVTTTSTTPIPTTTASTTPKPSSPSPSRTTLLSRPYISNSFNTGSGNNNGYNKSPLTSSTGNANTDSNPNTNNSHKGFSTYAYYHRTPHSVISSGYNSQLRQSYLINHQQNNNNNNAPPSSSVAPIVVETRTSQQQQSTNNNPTGRKVGSGGGTKTILYTSSKPSTTSRQVEIISSTTPRQYHQSSTIKATVINKQPVIVPETMTHPIIDPNSSLLEYPEDEYYDETESEDYAALVASGGTGAASASNIVLPNIAPNNNNNNNLASNSRIEISDRMNRASKNIPVSPQVPTSYNTKQSSSSSAKTNVSPSVVSTIHQNTQDNSTEDPYYYEDDYLEDNANLQQPQSQAQSDGSSSGAGSSSSSSDTDSPEYYDENDESTINVNSHHFTHVDVPRIPFAKPNQERVLVTNGKPFLPRLRRQSFYTHHLDPGSNLWNYYMSTMNTFEKNSNHKNVAIADHFGTR